jgi:peroxiredoxin
LVVISYDSADDLKRTATKRGVTFLLLSDPGSKTIEAHGILNQEATGKAKGVPYPGVFIIDQEGVIRKKLFMEGYKERHQSSDLVCALKDSRQ